MSLSEKTRQWEIKCLAQGHNVVVRPGFEPRLVGPEFKPLTHSTTTLSLFSATPFTIFCMFLFSATLFKITWHTVQPFAKNIFNYFKIELLGPWSFTCQMLEMKLLTPLKSVTHSTIVVEQHRSLYLCLCSLQHRSLFLCLYSLQHRLPISMSLFSATSFTIFCMFLFSATLFKITWHTVQPFAKNIFNYFKIE